MAQFEGTGKLIFDGTSQKAYDLRFSNTTKLHLDGVSEMDVSGCKFDSNSELLLEDSTDVSLERIWGKVTLDSAVDTRISQHQGPLVGVDGTNLHVSGHEGTVDLTGWSDFDIDGQYTWNTSPSDSDVLLTSCIQGTISMRSYQSAGNALHIVGGVSITADVQIDRTLKHGVLIDTSGVDHKVTGRVQASGLNTSNTYDNVQVDDSQVTVQGLQSRAGASSSTRYGINIASGSFDCIVVANDLGDASDYGTAPLVDAGSGTVTTFPGGTLGDNFAT